MKTSSTEQSASSPSPCRRALLRPVLYIRNAIGYFRSLSFADPDMAKRDLGKVDKRWRRKIDVVLSSPDNAHIPRVKDAGHLEGGLITMHNGIKVGARSYYGDGILNMLAENGGVHEPQEERAFAEVLKAIKPGASMLELGAYWGFYSLWFSTKIASTKCFLVEPDFARMRSGMENFKRQGISATFHQAYVDAEDNVAGDGTDIISVDGYCRSAGIEHLEILHSDIQGAESAMLTGAECMLSARKIDYVFISTHSNELHDACVQKLKNHAYVILASANIDESYSGDGLIVAKGPHIQPIQFLEISHRPPKAKANPEIS